MGYFLDLDGMRSRLKEVLQRTGMLSKDFCETIEIPPATLSSIINERTAINIATINAVVAALEQGKFPTLSEPTTAHWFLFGVESDPETTITNTETQVISPQPPLGVSPQLLGQLEDLGRISSQLIQHKPIEIERIVVFYTDKSFATFRYSKED